MALICLGKELGHENCARTHGRAKRTQKSGKECMVRLGLERLDARWVKSVQL